MGPLPFAVCIPAILLHADKKQQSVSAEACFYEGRGYTIAHIICNESEENTRIDVSSNMYTPLKQACQAAHNIWCPHDRFHANLVFNDKNIRAFTNIIGL
jgi:hypothetical protein